MGFQGARKDVVSNQRQARASQAFQAQQEAFGGHEWTGGELQRIEAAGRELQAAAVDSHPASQERFENALRTFLNATTPLKVLIARMEEIDPVVDAQGRLAAFVVVMRELGEREPTRAAMVYQRCSRIGDMDLRFRCRGLTKKGAGEFPIESLSEVVALVERAQAGDVSGDRLAVMLDKVSRLIGGIA